MDRDHVLVSRNFVKYIKDCFVCYATMCSDHFPIGCVIESSFETYMKKSDKYVGAALSPYIK